MVILRPKDLKKSKYSQHEFVRPDDFEPPVFVIHPPTSKLAEMLVIDSTALQNENYSGIYDEQGDYIPQYCDDPEKIPRGALAANAENSPAPIGDGAKAPVGENNPLANDPSSDPVAE